MTSFLKCTIFAAITVGSLQRASAASIYTAEHGDLGIAYEGGALEPHYHLGPAAIVDGSPVGNAPDGMEFAPDELITFVADPSVARPAGAQWNFLGSASGAPIWFLPQAEDSGKPFFGIASEELTPGDWTVLSLSLTGMNGPAGGHFSLYQTDGFGSPIVQFATSDGITGTDSYNLIIGGHAHYNWAFTEPGIYELEFTVSGTHASDGFKTASATYTFGVTQVPEPGSSALGLLAAGALLGRRR